MPKGPEFSPTPEEGQEAELELTAENKPEFLRDYAETRNTLAADNYRHELALLKVRRAEQSGDQKLAQQLWEEFPQRSAGIEQTALKRDEMYRAIMRSDVYHGLKIFRPGQADAEALALVCSLPLEEKSEFRFLIAQKMRGEMVELTQRMKAAYDWRLRSERRGKVSIEEAVADYNANMTNYPDQQITGEQAQRVIDFYNGKTTQGIIDKYREHLPPDMVAEILEYDSNFVRGA